MTALLELRGLRVRFTLPGGEVEAVGGVDLDLGPGETLGIVGESGSGKTQLAMAILGLLARNGRASGSARFMGEELIGRPPAELDRVRGGRITVVFQDPMTSLNPVMRIGRQLTEVIRRRRDVGEAGARLRAVAMLDRVGIPEAARRLDRWPHELSGGMRQRVMIAMALLGEPELLIADEPTTALDVTVQAQILELLADLQRERGMAIILITHALGVVAGLCERVAVMYAGRIVETGPATVLFARPLHPYTRALLQASPRLDVPIGAKLEPIEGQPPDLAALPQGCAFRERCPRAVELCGTLRPPLRPIEPDQLVACHRAEAA